MGKKKKRKEKVSVPSWLMAGDAATWSADQAEDWADLADDEILRQQLAEDAKLDDPPFRLPNGDKKRH